MLKNLKLENLTKALIEALEDEYKARATYRLVIQKFGEIRPFVNIIEAEERHIQALLPLFEKYQIPIPVDDWENRVQIPESVLSACQAGVQAEIENGEMYERLLALTSDFPDVQRVFLNLQRASQENHLRAFQRCVQRAGNPGGSRGKGRGKGRGHQGRGGRRHCDNPTHPPTPPTLS
ncbi:MAG: ferritin-like domain-containing protein [Cyanobacteriota bacterium]